jgi:hypothetical protein
MIEDLRWYKLNETMQRINGGVRGYRVVAVDGLENTRRAGLSNAAIC